MSHREPPESRTAEYIFIGLCILCCLLFAVFWAVIV